MRAWILLLSLVACQAVHRTVWTAGGPRPEQDLPAAWDTTPPSEFERQVARLSAGRVAWSAASLDTLRAALAVPDAAAVRATVLLAYDPSTAATEVLIGRLEARAHAPQRGLDAGDLVAAAALDGRGVEARLVVLVIGDAPHPDLEVRVECARTALRAGREDVVPFLLTVLRALTPAEREHAPDWERVTTLMWAKSRAGEALSARLGIECRVRPDGSWTDQMAEADRLEGLFAR